MVTKKKAGLSSEGFTKGVHTGGKNGFFSQFVDLTTPTGLALAPHLNSQFSPSEEQDVTIEGVFSVVVEPTERPALALTVNYNDNSAVIYIPKKYAHQAFLNGIRRRPNEPSKTVIDFTV